MSRPRIPITNLQKILRLERTSIRDAARRALESVGCEKDVSLVFVEDERIRELNRKFLDHDQETDVIAFPLEDETDDLLGEVVVSTETAVREAGRRKKEPLDELLLYVVHGVLHLLGYDDHSPNDRRRMRRAEAALLAGHAARRTAANRQRS